MTRVHFRTCHLCEAMCGLKVELDGDRPVRVSGDPDDPLSRGYLCPKATGLIDIHEDPDRLKRPQKRVGDRFETIGWDQALDEVSAKIKDVQRRHGRHSVAMYFGNPTVHNWASLVYGVAFQKAVGSRQRYSATSLDQLPAMLAALEMFGHQLLMPVPDVDRADYVLMLGANPAASGGSLMSAPGVPRRIKALRERGGKIVVVDPRRTETAELADRHVFIRPGTDAWLLAAMTRELFVTGKTRLGRLAAFVDGVDAVKSAVEPFTPELAAERTGIDAKLIRTLANELASAPRGFVYGRVGLSTQRFGGLCQWLINVLNILSGQLDSPGGVMFTKPPIDLVALASLIGMRGHFGRRKSRLRGLPEFGGEFPAATLGEELETPGEGQIKALITHAGNPVLSAPNGRRIERGLAGLELVVAIDVYVNATTRHAHYILPPTFGLEKDHYDLALAIFSVRNSAKYSLPAVPADPEARHDHEILGGLALRLAGPKYLPRVLGEKILAASPERLLDVLLRTGPYGRGFNPFRKGLSLAALKASPHGVDLGPLEPSLPGRLGTPDHRIRLAPPLFLGDLPRLREAERARPAASLSLIGRRERSSNNSWMHNVPKLIGGKARGRLFIHPDDAAPRQLSSGDRAVVRSRVGSVEAVVEVTPSVLPGVVSLPHGYGHARPGVGLRVASQLDAPSMNDVTDDGLVDDLTGNARLSDVPVEVSRVR